MKRAGGGGSVLRREAAVAGAIIFALASCGREPAPERRPPTAQPAPAAAPTGARTSASVGADDGQWTRPAKDYASLRYSGLDQIDTSNVAKLQPAWTFETGVLRGQEAAPIVANNTLYIVTPYPNVLYALDLTKPGAPLEWKYEPKPDASSQGVACCDVVNRGAVYADGKVIISTLDDHVAAVDAKTGKEIWKTKVGSIDIGETITMAPLGVDLRTGRPNPNPLTKPLVGKVVRDICPASPGVKDWQPSAFSPRTGLLYIPHQNLCQDSESLEASYIAGTPYVGMNVRMQAGPGGNRGVFTAWDPVSARPAWEIKENFPVWSGALVTAGDVVFYGTMDGWFKAVDAHTGKLLLAVQDRLGDHRPAHHVPPPRWKAVRGDHVRGGRLVGRDRRRRTRCARLHRGARLRRRHDRSTEGHQQGRDAVFLRSPLTMQGEAAWLRA
ncbi:MAG TPA: PQQ-binding-like beta-propeller repeat protein [Gemmatimonadaceae bacterium]|nr:PQQ-binding-like beta-propeller repeat protein [Gemmatimonadaceae bacterium]